MAHVLRNRPRDIGRARARFLAQRFGQDLVAARAGAGLTQRVVARLAGVSQPMVSRMERGRVSLTLEVAARLAAAVGGEVGLMLYPGRGVGLRDSGQLRAAELIHAALPTTAHVRFELPIGEGSDRRAADMVVELVQEAVLIEIERWLADYQAQYRAAQRKRQALAAQLGKPVRLVWVVGDTRRNRERVAEHAAVVASAFPVSSRRAWVALTAGSPLGADALIWLRERDRLPRRLTGSASPRSRGG